MYHSFLIHSFADGHLGCFHVLAIINSAVMNIGVHVSLSDLVSSVCMPRSGIAGSYGSSISSFLRKRRWPVDIDIYVPIGKKKKSITFKNCESLYRAPAVYILYVKYTSI